MQLAHQLSTATVLPALEGVRELVTESLWGDWIIRIEHTDGKPRAGDGWAQWGEAFFAVNDPESVIDAIISCCIEYPDEAVRLCAWKLRPETRLVFWIRRARQEAPLVRTSLPQRVTEFAQAGTRPDISQVRERIADHRFNALPG